MDITIVGAGGMGREVFSWLTQEIKTKQDICVKGFLDDNPNALDGYNYPVEIVGSIAEYQPQEDELFVVAIMDPVTKRKVVEALKSRDAKFYTMVHPSVLVSINVQMGEGCVVAPNCLISADITIGDFVFLNTAAVIGHDVKIGNFSSINGLVSLAGNVAVEEECMIGNGAIVIPKRHIGKRSIVGAGSVVVKDVAAGLTVVGNPAKQS